MRMVGTGKSTVSQTVASWLKDSNYLGSGSLKREYGDHRSPVKFLPTLIRQQMLRISEISPGEQNALDVDPRIASKIVWGQFEKQPLSSKPEKKRKDQIYSVDSTQGQDYSSHWAVPVLRRFLNWLLGS